MEFLSILRFLATSMLRDGCSKETFEDFGRLLRYFSYNSIDQGLKACVWSKDGKLYATALDVKTVFDPYL